MTHQRSPRTSLLPFAFALVLAACGSPALGNGHPDVDACAACSPDGLGIAADVLSPSADTALPPATGDPLAAGHEDAGAPVDVAPTSPTDALPAGARAADAGHPYVAHQIALTQDQLNKLGAGNRAVDPQTLHIFIGNKTHTCGDPFDSGGCGSWSVLFKLPPGLQRPGTWHIDDPLLDGFDSFEGADRGGNDCSGGGGSLGYGDVTVLEIDDRHLVVRLDDVREYQEFDASGTYTVDRCP
jgi:hypothetical protein